MNIQNITKIKGIVELLIENESRINEAKPVRYWYPLSLATYGTDEILMALDSMCSFRTSMAEKTLQFERQFAKYQSSADAIMVNSGSSADLLLSFLLTNPLDPILKPGDEILIPVVTWPTQIWSAMMAGLTVRLVDVDPETLNIDLDDLERSITPETKALFLVHLMGNPCTMDRILALTEKHGIVILEDCCEAMGAKWDGKHVGNFGLGGTFSFFFSHHITTMEGGMVCVQDVHHAEQLRLMRAHGWVRNVDYSKYVSDQYHDIDPRYAFVNWGLNVRPTEIQAGFGICQLQKAPEFAERRAKLAHRFTEFLKRWTDWIRMPKVPEKAESSWFTLPMMVQRGAPFTRVEITTYLEDAGVETRPIVAGNVARHPVGRLFAPFGARTFPGADEIHEYGFYIGLSPFHSDDNMDRLVEVLEQFLIRHSKK